MAVPVSNDQISKYLADPLSFPPEFKTWVVKYLEQNQPSLQAGQLVGKLQLVKLADPGTGKVIGSSGNAAAAVFPPGYVLAYTEFTSNVAVSATTEATANAVVTAAAVTFDGATTVCIEFFSPSVGPAAAAGALVVIVLYDGTSIGLWGQTTDPAAAAEVTAMYLRRYITPSAGSHTYSVRAYEAGGAGTVAAGAGGAAAFMPGFIRITKV